jgi:predicted  nucleic acid-binding Zn-ribbon protein
MESTELKKELETVIAQRDSLRSELESAQKTLTVAREAMLAGKPKAIEALTTAQARVTALHETIAALVEQESLLQQNFDAALEKERREAIFADLLRSDEAAEDAARQHEAALIEFDSTVRAFGARLLESRRNVAAQQNAFLATLRKIVPRFDVLFYRADEESRAELEAVMNELATRGAKLQAVRAESFRLHHRRTPIDDMHACRSPRLAFGEAIEIVEQITLHLEREAEQKSEADAA